MSTNTLCNQCMTAFFLFCYRAVTDSINMLLNACMSAAPGQKECDNALRNIQVGLGCSDVIVPGLALLQSGLPVGTLEILSSDI